MKQKILTLSDYSQNKATELFITFSLAQKNYAVAAEKVIEVVQLPQLDIVEKVPEYIAGMLNLRGQVIVVVDMCSVLGIERDLYSTECQILILNTDGTTGGKKIGIIVDSVKDVFQIDRMLIEPLPYQSKEKFISGVYKESDSLVAILDFKKISDDILECEIPTESVFDIEKYGSNVKKSIFAQDLISQSKFKKRALKLRKILRDTDENLNYQENYFISFALNDEIYFINLRYVKEISKLKNMSVTKVPCVPDFISGIINLRGEFITIVDIKNFMNITPSGGFEHTERTKIIVIMTDSLQIGILVDDVFGIRNIPDEKLNHNAQTKYEKHKYTSAEAIIDGRVMCLFDIKKFLEDERLYIEDAV